MRRLAIVHPKTLVGKEILERVDAYPALAGERRLLSGIESEIGELADAGGAAFVGRLDDEAFEGVDLALFCGSIDSERPILARLPRRLPVILASAGAQPSDAPPAVSGVAHPGLAGATRLSSPHPAAVALALLLAPLHAFELRRAVATVLLPVSLADDGIDELFTEARALLTFQSPPRAKRYETQIAFNALPAALGAAELERATVGALGVEVALSVQALQAGIFHAVGVSLHVELGAAPAAADLRRALGRAPHLELAKQPGRLGPVGVAGGERLAVGEVRAAGGAGSYWIWAAMDNLVRGAALNALELGEALLASGRPA